MNKIVVAILIVIIIALAAGAYVYFFKAYQDSQFNAVRLYKNDIEGKAMKNITNSIEGENQRIQEQLNQ
ncbi:MAG: hypothetical protein A3J62_00915 [Candidatus Buchananbacteria bacterium RIFCSPHIGHO2_02_FULL_38_8]|uniref:Uncharacterized protein n=2 Tax=Candidatus Buchananiibacteriota TaxID=1817903 RepID=A0A1G1XYG4_9BACT|nr:hypothetical protein [uncultured bacterium]OGY45125.1 MAG: hypothetical protein A2731_04030 [Candidatus Buchananbacteria bacterium RIFCSPHIGHO2_01_FULL_39_8]OGY47947.1 MAG: hypothetical protein A3J62_00915 [Candidatus Buchananbacteria bacterium RIFCSPHIGHO2_02_FULL_38_8]